MRRFLRIALLISPILVLIALYVLASWPASTLYGPVTAHGARTDRAVAITFDDGPNSGATGAVLDVLRDERAQATFFMTGRSVLAAPELARRVVTEGHIAANHSFSHRKRDALLDFAYDDVERTQAVIEQATGVRPSLYRPPNGFHTPWSLRAVRRGGLHTVVWDVDPYDWKDPTPEALVRRVLDQVRPGSIILLHDGADTRQDVDRSATVVALPAMIRGLRERGYRIVTVPDLLGIAPYQGWEEEARRAIPFPQGMRLPLTPTLSRAGEEGTSYVFTTRVQPLRKEGPPTPTLPLPRGGRVGVGGPSALRINRELVWGVSSLAGNAVGRVGWQQ